MRYDDGQFRGFDGRDNRRDVLALFARMGHGLPEAQAGWLRAGFLRSLLPLSRNGFAGKGVNITPCTPVEAYLTFVALTGVLGVPAEDAARRLERLVSRGRSG